MRILILFVLSMIFFNLAYWVGPLWFLVFLMFPTLLFGLRLVLSKGQKEVFLWGALLGVLFLSGIPPLLNVESEVFGASSALDPQFILAVIGIFALAACIFGSIFGALFVALKIVAKKIPYEPLILFIFPLFWVGAELIIRMVTFGFDWWFVGIPLITAGPFREIAGLFSGVPALSFITVLSGSILYTYCAFRPFSRSSLFYIGFSSFGLITLVLYGVILHERVSTEYPANLPSIAIIQPNVKFPETFPIEHDANYGPLIKEALARNVQAIIFSAQIVSPVTADANLSKDFWVRTLGKTLIEAEATIIFYIPIKMESGAIFQTMFALRHGEVIGKYKKEILFPASDYRPSGLYSLVIAEPPGYSITPYFPVQSNERNGILTPNGVLGAAICNELFSPKVLERIERTGAPILVVSGSDRPFLSNLIFNGTLRMAQLRASEAHVWIFRAYKTGISAVIAPNGDILNRLNRGERGVIFFGSTENEAKKI